MTIEDVREMCHITAAENGFDIPCPIAINNRLKATLGRVMYEKNGTELSRIEFSKTLLEEGTETQIHDTILHELAHVFTFLETGERHGHDAKWKAMCVRIGAKPERLAGGTIYVENQKAYKYSLFCKECGQNIANYYRAGKIIQNIDTCTTKCCHAGIKVVQNY